MKITILMEDTCGNVTCEFEHGLSIYVETKKHRLLVDTGASNKTLTNAEKLEIDLSKVDTVILSHGHYDHSGGIRPFYKINPEAIIYMQKSALLDYYHGEKYIGIDKEIAELSNVRLLGGGCEIDEEISIFTNITGRKYWPKSNMSLSVKEGKQNIQDSFSHEQCIVIHDKKEILISGCAHNGILNILDRYKEIYGGSPDIVISGFHMTKKTDYTAEEMEIIRQTAKELVQYNTIFYTGHCTGQRAIDIMKPIMKDKLIQIHCGMNVVTE